MTGWQDLVAFFLESVGSLLICVGAVVAVVWGAQAASRLWHAAFRRDR